jgi:hypothetical protein
MLGEKLQDARARVGLQRAGLRPALARAPGAGAAQRAGRYAERVLVVGAGLLQLGFEPLELASLIGNLGFERVDRLLGLRHRTPSFWVGWGAGLRCSDGSSQ